jgi:hypothetical protein
MTRHLICLTIDTDPDGMTAQVMNRQMLAWQSLEKIRPLLDELEALRGKLGRIPITWFIRADGQLEDVFGSPLYVLDRFEPLWSEVQSAGHEIGWHPHLYRQSSAAEPVVLMTDPVEAVDEIERLWSALARSFPRTVSFRNGEGWHCAATLAAVEKLGFLWDSTAIPGRAGIARHPIDWTGTPNHPYFPDRNEIRFTGAPRMLLELPMNTWSLKTSYDSEPKLRYINPAIHEHLFAGAASTLRKTFREGLHVWILVLHPDEAASGAKPDLLYARSAKAVCMNLKTFAATIWQAGHEVQFVTMSQAGQEWRRQGETS